MRFTDKGIQALKARSDRYEIVEDGATGLAVRVSPRGVKTFSFLYRHGGKPRRLTLGVYRDHALEGLGRPSDRDARSLPYLGLADARIKLAEARKLRDGGIDPGGTTKQQRQAERKAQTVAELIDAYVEKWAKANKKASSAAEDERMLNKDVRPAWGERKATTVTRQDVIALLDDIVARGSPVIANRTLAVVRKMFRWAVRQGIVPISPAHEIDRPGGRETSRERVLSDTEIAEVWRATERLGTPYGPLVRLLLVTGQRRGEVAGMRRKRELDTASKLWTIPRARTKNGLDHEVPLSPLALEILKAAAAKPAPPPDAAADGQPAPAARKPKAEEIDCVFVSGRNGDNPVREFKGAKRRLDQLILDARREALKAAGADPAEAKPMPHWTLHDLRRTMRTNLSRLRLDPEICERVINHVPKGVRRTYDVHQYRDEKREVLNAWATRLKRIVTAKPATGGRVVRMPEPGGANSLRSVG